MKKNSTTDDIRARVMEEIESKHIGMRPKAFFVCLSCLLAAGIWGGLGVAFVFITVATVRLRAYPPFGFLTLGPDGVPYFAMVFPWVPLLVAAGALAAGILLLQAYDISYKHSFLIVGTAAVAVVLVTGLLAGRVIETDRIHQRYAIPFVFSPELRHVPVVVGTVESHGGTMMDVVTPHESHIPVMMHERTVVKGNWDVGWGKTVRAGGKWQGDILEASHVIVGE